ncbi:MAG: hypothetical protein ABJI00_00635 [Paracoccaceae bacterium]
MCDGFWIVSSITQTLRECREFIRRFFSQIIARAARLQGVWIQEAIAQNLALFSVYEVSQSDCVNFADCVGPICSDNNGFGV